MTYKPHWHVIVTHFPISLFGAAFFFQILHNFWYPDCFELSANVLLVAGAASMVPTTVTGWRAWKRNYVGAHIQFFKRKIVIAIGLLAVSIALSVWRVGLPGMFQDVSHGIAHWIYLAGNSLIIAGAAAEGYYGGKLNHH